MTHNPSKPGKTVLITGAGGCIGSALARGILGSDSAFVLLLDHSEQNLYEIHAELSAKRSAQGAAPVANAHSNWPFLPVLGDVTDDALLNEILERHRPEVIYHAAAFKHVPLMESNAIAVIRNNILGTWTLANAALRHRIPRLLMISTDKAVNPRSAMGAAKRVAELILQRLATPRTRMTALRLGNVLGSHGSVVPLFQEQISRGGPITVTHPEARRYFLTLSDTIDLILAADRILEGASSVLVPELGEPVKIVDLAKRLIEEAGRCAGEIEIVFRGLRPGDKLTEELLFSSESLDTTPDPRLGRINSPPPDPQQLDSAIQAISEGVRLRDLTALLDTLCTLVPEYEPSETLLRLAACDRPAARA